MKLAEKKVLLERIAQLRKDAEGQGAMSGPELAQFFQELTILMLDLAEITVRGA